MYNYGPEQQNSGGQVPDPNAAYGQQPQYSGEPNPYLQPPQQPEQPQQPAQPQQPQQMPQPTQPYDPSTGLSSAPPASPASPAAPQFGAQQPYPTAPASGAGQMNTGMFPATGMMPAPPRKNTNVAALLSGIAAAVFLVSAAFIIKGTYNPFIYFNF